jgi:hypothetical protein
MRIKQSREFDRLHQVRQFGTTHREAFPASSAAHDVFAAIDKAADELAASDVLKLTASVAVRAGRKKAASKSLYGLLLGVSQLARVFRARGRAVPPLELPESKSDQALLTTSRQFARDVGALDAEFAAHGLGAAQITAAAGELREAMRERGKGRADHVGAKARIHELLKQARMDVQRLDLIVGRELAHDPVITAVWKQMRRVLRTPAAPVPAAPEPAAPVPVDAASPADTTAAAPAVKDAATVKAA